MVEAPVAPEEVSAGFSLAGGAVSEEPSPAGGVEFESDLDVSPLIRALLSIN
jgi:hypothetical protein